MLEFVVWICGKVRYVSCLLDELTDLPRTAAPHALNPFSNSYLLRSADDIIKLHRAALAIMQSLYSSSRTVTEHLCTARRAQCANRRFRVCSLSTKHIVNITFPPLREQLEVQGCCICLQHQQSLESLDLAFRRAMTTCR